MLALLRRPRWLVLGVISFVAAGVFVNLGLWQLDRLEEVRLDNAVAAARLATAPVPLTSAIDPTASTSDAGTEHTFRRVVASGEFDPSEEVLIRSQTNDDGVAGFHVVTPLRTFDGPALLVNRGWIPLDMDEPPVPAAPSGGEVSIEVVIQPSQEPGILSPADPDGDAPRRNRIDIEAIAEHVPYPLYPVYGVAREGDGSLPLPVALPELSDGPHLWYAIQWFAFAAIAAGGFVLLLAKSARSGIKA